MHDEHTSPEPTRRGFLKGAASLGAGLVLGFRWQLGTAEAAEGAPFVPNAFVRIAPDDTVTVIAKHLEMGQGSYTGIATVLADELDAAWSQVRVEAAPSNPKVYANLGWGIQGTGGSSAMANSWAQLRKAGAAAREMLMRAAAGRWGVPPGTLRVEKGAVHHDASGRVATFGELASAAAELDPPDAPVLKEPADFTLIGKAGAATPRVDAREKSDGSARFALDLRLSGMLTALLARPPRFGGVVQSFDDAGCRKVKGFVKAVKTPLGVAVIADGFWAARKAREALRVTWDDSKAEARSSEEILADYRRLAATPGKLVHNDGDAEKKLAEAATVIEATYEFPYLAHAPMEPINGVIHFRKGQCDYYSGSQIQTVDHGALAKILGIDMGSVKIHTQLAGGSFGRRATPGADIASEAALVVKAAELDVPLRVMWTREDDLTGGLYRPASLHKVRLGVDQEGKLSGWHHRVVSQSILTGTPFAAMVKDGVDHTSVEGVDLLPYGVTDRRVELHTTQSPISVLWWRSVGHSTNAFLIETLIDELAVAAHEDPVEFRRRLMPRDARERGVLDLVVEKAEWGRQPPPGLARGLAVHKSFGSYVAQVAEVGIGDEGLPRVHRVVCAVDCGQVVNPRMVEAQMQGGIGFGLGAALFNAIPIEAGRAAVSNFDEYRALRIPEMPRVEVYTVESAAPPTGVGEPGVPPIAPAVANAWFRLTGKRVRRLPFLAAQA